MAVSVHLWPHAFVLGYGDPCCLACHQDVAGLLGDLARSLSNTRPPSGWQESMSGFRLFGLRYWKLEEAGGVGVSRGRLANLPWQANLPTPVAAQFVRGRMGMILGSVHSVYE